DDLEAERLRIQREIEELENTLGASVLEDSDDDELDLPQNVETCLQMNLVYQEVLKEKLAELEQLLNENQQQQKEIEAQISSTSSSSLPGIPPQKQFLGYFMKPYFKDKLTGLGPPANEETKAKLSHGTRPIEELKIKRWDGWQKTLLTNAVAKDTMKRMLQPKLSKLDYLSAKMSRADEEGKEELKKQIDLIEKEIVEISALKDDQLLGNRHDDHDWEKISNIDFEALRQAEDLKRFWQNYLHPSIDKSVWKKDEIDKLKGIVEEYNCCHWDKIAEALGTNRTAFMCFQTYQRYISKTFRRREWTKEEDEILRKLVEKMRTGNFIPYIQMSYFMEGRDGSQLAYRWTSVLNPSLKKGPWSKEEDQLLRNAVAKYGIKEWGKIRLEVPGRLDSACRDRYLDCLQENVKKGPWSEEEVELLKEKVKKYGVGKWSKIASEIPTRIDCQCLSKWKLLTQSKSKEHQSKGIKRKRTTVPQKRKRQKVLKSNIKQEMITSSEDENQINNMDSDVESEVPKDLEIPQNREIPGKDYVQPDIKEWIPLNANTVVHSVGTVRTVWVCPPTIEDELDESTKKSVFSRIRSEKSKCPKVMLSFVRNTVLNHFGNLERTYKTTSPINIKKKRPARDMASLINELLKVITPWIGNVILPAPANENTFCKGTDPCFSSDKTPKHLWVVITIQLPTVIQQKSLPNTILSPLSTSRRPLRPIAPSPQFIAQYPHIVAPLAQIVAPSPQIVAPPTQIVAPSEVPQIITSSEPLIPLPDIPSDVVSFNPHLIFPEQSSEVDDWMNGKGGIPLPHLELSLPYLPPSAASIKTLTSLLKVKQSLLAAAVNILPDEYQNHREEEDQVAAIRKMIADRFASNPAYLLLKARFLSCFILPALLATINPSEKFQLPTDNNGDDAEVLYLQKREKRIQPPATVSLHCSSIIFVVK
uniref:Small nuclear RNA activating complex, polypeptide 4 n=1 Tax=Cyprinus carpio TaxID=7962 RepID=A0A8C2JNZ3_CYPCA